MTAPGGQDALALLMFYVLKFRQSAKLGAPDEEMLRLGSILLIVQRIVGDLRLFGLWRRFLTWFALRYVDRTLGRRRLLGRARALRRAYVAAQEPARRAFLSELTAAAREIQSKNPSLQEATMPQESWALDVVERFGEAASQPDRPSPLNWRLRF